MLIETLFDFNVAVGAPLVGDVRQVKELTRITSST